MKPKSPFDLGRALALCVELPLIEHKLREAGLFATAAMMNKVVSHIGYETAELKAKAAKP